MNEQTTTIEDSQADAPEDIESEVLRRYDEGAQTVQPALCCPTSYDSSVMNMLPEEILNRDYGCGDPSKYVEEGETVLDLGSGGGKICYILSHKVGPGGEIVGVDFNDEMLKLARKYQDHMKEQIGYGNVRFIKGRIQDLALDLALAQEWLNDHPVQSVEEVSHYEAECERLRREEPMIAKSSVDVVVSNCVLNLVRSQDKQQLFGEIFRVLKRGGRAVISDIVCDEYPTQSILDDRELWSGCISGAFREDQFIEMFEDAGFYGIEILERQQEPWQVVEGIEFRSITLRAFKGKEGPCKERNQALVYRGPWKVVKDDDGHTFYRGNRMAVCDKTHKIMTNPFGPYQQHMLPVEPREVIPLEEAGDFTCQGTRLRHPRETKGIEYNETMLDEGDDCCAPGCCDS